MHRSSRNSIATARPRRVLRAPAVDALASALREAPVDDEPLTPEERAAIAESRKDVAAGRVVAHAEVRKRLLRRR